MTLELDEVKRCTDLLQAIVSDRALLAGIALPEQVALLTAAGKAANPDRDAQRRLTKAVQKKGRVLKQNQDRQVRASVGIRASRQGNPIESLGPGVPVSIRSEQVLHRPRHCYICKAEFRTLHFFYDALCPPCGDFNYSKRSPTGSLWGRTALITGARVKIGFQAGLMLLRSGARVIVSTRFPADAAKRYALEFDFAAWSDRLHIHGLDLRHAPSVELFAEYVGRRYERLDMLINNAAQTVRRPPGFYQHLQKLELGALDSIAKTAAPLLSDHLDCVATLPASQQNLSWRSSDRGLGIRASAALSQVPYHLEQDTDQSSYFPAGHFDADQQQVDLRKVNSWRLKLAEVETAEMLEVHLVNAVAPFILCGKLKPLMLRDRVQPGHIVNVSAMEGSFSRGTKTDKHPHTNMAKAALNMMTLTSGQDYAGDRIYMNAVDTGWVTDEDPALHAHRKTTELDFQPPLDIVDGAARILDPIFSSLQTGQCVWGNFFKDYRPTAW